MTILNLDEIQKRREKLLKDINNAVEKCKFSSEEKLKIEVMTVFSNFFNEYDINFADFVDYEVSKIGHLNLKGRIDALYGSLVVEFKKYNLTSNKSELNKAIRQVTEKYLDIIPKEARNDFAGIIFDGKNIVFIKYNPKKENWSYEAKKFNIYTLYDWLLLLAGLFKKTVSYEALKNDFSIETPLAKDFITVLYKQLNQNLSSNPRIKMLFDEWNKTFRYIYGGVLDESKLISDFEGISAKILKTKEVLYVDRFLFVLYTYYAFIIKLIASEITCISLKLPFDSPSRYLMKENDLRKGLRTIEEGKFFKDLLGVENYIEGGFFAWYLECWNDDTNSIIMEILQKINEYNPRTLIDSNNNSRDILRNLYQNIIPKRIRHDLGEYYTPQWLVQLSIEEAGYNGNPKHKILDPGCGSGTFLVEFINQLKNNIINKMGKEEALDTIINNVVGFDVNPVAILTARTNYLLAISDLISEKKELVTLPVYLADSILTPTTEGRGKLKQEVYNVSTVEGIFKIPKDIVVNGSLSYVLDTIEGCINNAYPAQDFIELLKNKLLKEKGISLKKETEKIILELYITLLDLHKQNKNKIWAKIIQNSFAPLMFSNFDYVIGNPPWIKWEFLSEEYKKKLRVLYLNIYKLFSFTGMKASMGFAHDDISIVFTYVCMDKYLKNGGKLSFVLKQTLYKSIAGKEFRKFAIEKENSIVPVKVLKVHDLLDIKPFKFSGSETSVAIIEKGKKTKYPVPYFIWKLKGRVQDTMNLDEVKNNTSIKEFDAYPDPDTSDPTDVWVNFEKGAEIFKNGSKKKNFYQVRHGLVNDLNSVFFIKILDKINDHLKIENDQIGKKKVESVKTRVEKDLIYPIVKPRHVKKWIIKGYYYIIIPQRKNGENNESELRINYPKTYNYLYNFKKDLVGRSSKWFKGGDKPFYSLFGLGDYTFKPYKVVWSSIGYLHAFAVAGRVDDDLIGKKVIIPDNTIGYLSFDSGDEAHFVCAILNSDTVKDIFARRSTKSKWGISITMVRNVPVPKYDPENVNHKKLSDLSKKAHNDTKNGKSTLEIEKEINEICKKIIN